ncbi:MAG TPA: hypothetical protein VK742_21310 [Candidatus Sulfotelmatobacter sp.]|nr:hypothetical protein [Candidatus Sulfotelmatobacter sp.]
MYGTRYFCLLGNRLGQPVLNKKWQTEFVAAADNQHVGVGNLVSGDLFQPRMTEPGEYAKTGFNRNLISAIADDGFLEFKGPFHGVGIFAQEKSF